MRCIRCTTTDALMPQRGALPFVCAPCLMDMDTPKRRISDVGLTLIKKHEGWRAHWYRDPVNIWTIGWGTTGHVQGVQHPHSPADPITKEMGEDLLLRALRHAEEAIHDYVTVPLTQGQHDALVSFIYNVGVGAFRRSTLLKHLNAGDPKAAAREFGRWVYAGGEVWDGLVHRRTAERKLFEGHPPLALNMEATQPFAMQPVGPDLERLLKQIQIEEVPQLA